MQSAMEQSRYLMWTRRKPSGKPHLPAFASPAAGSATSYGHSWEEQAFAEDSAGRFGGCVWPPRSYSCSFCSREFRSAQALGGHMNVHRRDRARLKMSPTSHVEGSHHFNQQQHQHLSDSCPPLAAQHLPQVCTLVHNSSPNPTAAHGVVASALLPVSPSRVSVASTQKNSGDQQILVSPSYSSSLIKEDRKGLFFSIPPPHSNQFSLRILAPSGLKLGREDLRLKEVGCGEERDDDQEDEEEGISRKRRRIDVAIPFVVRSSPSDGSPLQSDVLGLSPSPIEELDLELRLGDRPKVT